MWFSESDDVAVTSALSSLSEASGGAGDGDVLGNHLIHQVRSLVRRLCTSFAVPAPPEAHPSSDDPLVSLPKVASGAGRDQPSGDTKNQEKAGRLKLVGLLRS